MRTIRFACILWISVVAGIPGLPGVSCAADPPTKGFTLEPPMVNLKNLCVLVNCAAPPAKSDSSTPVPPASLPPPPPPPVILDVKGEITPGIRIFVGGEGFGNVPGELTLNGNFPNEGGVVRLTNLEWRDGYIFGTIPDVRGASDQQATLGVRTQRGAGTGIPRMFRATREEVLIPDSSLQRISCFTDSRNSCTAANSGIHGHHTGWVFGSNGVDTFSFRLRDGFVVTKTDNWVFRGSASLTDPPQGKNAGNLVVQWSYGFLDYSWYAFFVSVEGPAGVSPVAP